MFRSKWITDATLTGSVALAGSSGFGGGMAEAGTFESIPHQPISLGSGDVAALSMNLDGTDADPEMFVLSSSGSARAYDWRYSGSSSPINPFPTGWFTAGSQLMAVDMDGDGDDDIAAATANGPRWLENRRNQGEGFVMRDEIAPLGGGGAVDIGITDLFGVGRAGALFVFGDGRILWHGYLPGETDPRQVSLNTEGLQIREVAGANFLDQSLGDLVTIEHFGGGAALTAWLQLPGDSPSFARVFIDIETFNSDLGNLRVGDFDQDGDMDVFVASGNSGSSTSIRLYENRWSADEGFVRHDIATIPAARFELADFDGDGDLDIIAAPRQLSGLFWLENRFEFDETAFRPDSIPTAAEPGMRLTTLDYKDDLGLQLVTYASSGPTTWHYPETPPVRNIDRGFNHDMIGSAIDLTQPNELLVTTGEEVAEEGLFAPEGLNLTIRARGPVNLNVAQAFLFFGDGRLEVAHDHAMNLAGLVRVETGVTAELSAAEVHFPSIASHLHLLENSDCVIETPRAIVGGLTEVRTGSELTFTGEVELGPSTSHAESLTRLDEDAHLHAAGEVTSIKRLEMRPGSELHTPRLIASGAVALDDARILGAVEITGETLLENESRIIGAVRNEGVITVENRRSVISAGEYDGAGSISLVGRAGAPAPSLFIGGRFAPGPDALITSTDPSHELVFGDHADFSATDPGMFQTDSITLRAGGDYFQDFECVSRDYGADSEALEAGYEGVFPMHRLIVGPPPLANGNPAPATTRMVLVDNNDNAQDGQDEAEVLYVDTLVLQSNGEIRTEGHLIYCREFVDEGGFVDDRNNIIVIPTGCAADLDGDCVVGSADLSSLLGSWGGSEADLTGDGVVGSSDLAVMLGAWGVCAE